MFEHGFHDVAPALVRHPQRTILSQLYRSITLHVTLNLNLLHINCLLCLSYCNRNQKESANLVRIWNVKFHENPSGGIVAVPECRVDRHDERLSRFWQLLCKRAWKVSQGDRYLIRSLVWVTPEHSIIDRATWYELDSLGFESNWERDFPRPSRSTLVFTQPAVERVPSLLWGGKSVGLMVFKTPPAI